MLSVPACPNGPSHPITPKYSAAAPTRRRRGANAAPTRLRTGGRRDINAPFACGAMQAPQTNKQTNARDRRECVEAAKAPRSRSLHRCAAPAQLRGRRGRRPRRTSRSGSSATRHTALPCPAHLPFPDHPALPCPCFLPCACVCVLGLRGGWRRGWAGRCTRRRTRTCSCCSSRSCAPRRATRSPCASTRRSSGPHARTHARTRARVSGCASLLVRMRRSAAAFVNHDDESN
jgi:hypothetical protein